MTIERAPYAGVVSRGAALAVDLALANAAVFVGAGVVRLFTSLVAEIHPERLADAMGAVAWSAAVAVYFVWFWSVVGQTPGMRLLDLRVTHDGAPPGIGRAFVRFIGLVLSIALLFVGFLPVLFDTRRRGAHDFLAGTEVVYGDAAAVAPPMGAGVARMP